MIILIEVDDTANGQTGGPGRTEPLESVNLLAEDPVGRNFVIQRVMVVD